MPKPVYLQWLGDTRVGVGGLYWGFSSLRLCLQLPPHTYKISRANYKEEDQVVTEVSKYKDQILGRKKILGRETLPNVAMQRKVTSWFGWNSHCARLTSQFQYTIVPLSFCSCGWSSDVMPSAWPQICSTWGCFSNGENYIHCAPVESAAISLIIKIRRCSPAPRETLGSCTGPSVCLEKS